MSDSAQLQADLDRARGVFAELRASLREHYLGQEELIDQLLETLLAGGHVLLEGPPGLGKTTLVRLLAAVLGLEFRRIQFTPDLMPADILGTRILEDDGRGGRQFRQERGPIFTQVLLADEINRATPRTQSALLEAMEERQVSQFGRTEALDEHFFVAATQNPIEMEGTYPLPEAQLDRFLTKLTLTAPELNELTEILEATTRARRPLPGPVLRSEDLSLARALARAVPCAREGLEYAARLVLTSHPTHAQAPDLVRTFVRFGSGPRGAQALVLLGKARALLGGSDHVRAEDLTAVAPGALRHRLILGYEGEAAGVSPDAIVAALVDNLPPPF
jgi:MoxR-like ATPase